MATPTLTKKQQKATLSAKKTKVKDIIKNVLASPYESYYWPLVLPGDNETLKHSLESNLPRLKVDKPKIPWKDIKHVPKNERKKFREDYSKNLSEPQTTKNVDSSSIILGINDVTKLLENNSVAAVLIASDVQPKFMVHHLIDLAVLYRSPVLIVTDLRQILIAHCGVSSTTLALKKDINGNSKLELVLECIRKIHGRHPFPTNHINYTRSEEAPKQPVNLKKTETKSVTSKVTDEQIKGKIYLKRESKTSRAFAPQGFVKKSVRCDKMDVDETGFLSLSCEPIEAKINLKKTNNYKALIVKRLKGNPNRSRKKLQMLKAK